MADNLFNAHAPTRATARFRRRPIPNLELARAIPWRVRIIMIMAYIALVGGLLMWLA
jgi:hypothetical protein